MGIFSTGSSSLFNEGANELDINLSDDSQRALIESFLYEEAMRCLDENQIREFCESAEARALVEEGAIGKNTIVRLSKEDDLTRRIKVVSLQMAKESEDSLWDQLAKNRVKEKMLLSKIVKKYSNKAGKEATKAQRAYIKLNPLGSFIKKR